MNKIVKDNVQNVEKEHMNANNGYEFFRRTLVGNKDSDNCRVFYYELPPKKSAFPYHYHLKNEEFFFILSGEGLVRSPDGETKVKSGDFIFFPANENGAHKITNTSETQNLVYIDFDTHNDLEVAIYPDSNKLGIWGKDINKLYKTKNSVPYYDGE